MVIQSLAETGLSDLAIPAGVYFQRTNAPSQPKLGLSKKLACASLRLRVLFACFIVDAGDFFESRQEDWLWERLTSLSLTSRVLCEDTKPEDISHMLLGAAAAALKMPSLDTMELWNGRFGSAMLFRYQKAEDGQSAVITVRGTWPLRLEKVVTDAWDQVAERHRHGNVNMVTSLINPRVIMEFGDAIQHLGV